MTRPIRLLQIAKHFYPDMGGIETVTQNISEMLPAHGIEADVLCTATRASYPPLDVPYTVYRCAPGLHFGRNKSFSPEYLRQIARLSASYDCGLIHLPNPVAVAGVLAAWRRPLIALWHADIPQAPIRALAAPLDWALARKAASIIGPTAVHLTQSHRAAAIGAKGVAIFYPFDPSRLPAPTGASPVADQVRTFLRGRRMSISIGRLVAYKGFDVLIEAAKRFDNDLAAVIVGGGPLEQELRAAVARAGMADRVMLTGPIPDAALADLLDMAWMGCMPSVTAAEMYGVAQVEAFAFGKPVVSTRLARSGVSTINQHDGTGLVVEPGDAAALATAMRRLATDDALHSRLAAGARASFGTDHAIGPISQRYADLIRAVVGVPPPPAAAAAA